MAEAGDGSGHTPLTPEWTPAPRASHYPWQGDRPAVAPSPVYVIALGPSKRITGVIGAVSYVITAASDLQPVSHGVTWLYCCVHVSALLLYWSTICCLLSHMNENSVKFCVKLVLQVGCEWLVSRTCW